MVLIAHVMIALSSIGWAGYALVRPSRLRLRVSYILVAATLASGTYLVLHAHAALVSACTTGLIYLAIVGCGTLLAHRRLSGILE